MISEAPYWSKLYGFLLFSLRLSRLSLCLCTLCLSLLLKITRSYSFFRSHTAHTFFDQIPPVL
uniref:Uncharacterized protein n=1 Tax=Utricularia reniformis TaxID=192314 RepID=A0A1Y0B3U9_9LAMI|nr:hypothetical protein AEK19_MT1973 [Utricularia reniformis]ART32136.1 hypothetical protein AEK19_MT1973 [Utricularia reniformis]